MEAVTKELDLTWGTVENWLRTEMPGGTLLAAYVLKGTTDEQNRLRFLEGDKADDDVVLLL